MHTCPECGQACYCSGDIEDHDTGEEYEDVCSHAYAEEMEPADDAAAAPAPLREKHLAPARWKTKA